MALLVGCLPSVPSNSSLGMAVHMDNPIIGEVKVQGPRVQHHRQLHREFKVLPGLHLSDKSRKGEGKKILTNTGLRLTPS